MPEFRLTQISDPPLTRRYPKLTDNFLRVSDYIDATRPDLVVNSGDLAWDVRSRPANPPILASMAAASCASLRRLRRSSRRPTRKPAPPGRRVAGLLWLLTARDCAAPNMPNPVATFPGSIPPGAHRPDKTRQSGIGWLHLAAAQQRIQIDINLARRPAATFPAIMTSATIRPGSVPSRPRPSPSQACRRSARISAKTAGASRPPAGVSSASIQW